MRVIGSLTVLPMILVFGNPVKATTPVEDLVEGCRHFVERTEYSSSSPMCLGYLLGFKDGWTIHANHTPPVKGLPDFCEPRGVSIDQLMKVFIKWADDNPDKLHVPLAQAALSAFSAAWPCPGERQ